MTERKYLPTIADLIDRLSITLMKSIFLDRKNYREEMKLLLSDIDSLWYDWKHEGKDVCPSHWIYPVLVLMLANRYIWENEGNIRTTPITESTPFGYRDVAKRLILTHSINGVRNRAKNEISKIFSERADYKIDCLAADLHPDFGNWRVFDDDGPASASSG